MAPTRCSTRRSLGKSPLVPSVRGTAGRGSPFTADYGEVCVDWNVSEHLAAALEAQHYAVG
jgi:hypothetical protein